MDQPIKELKGPIFVFGASGFIGANLLQSVLAVRNDCYGITHNIRMAWRLKLMGIPPENILFCDVLFKYSVKQLFSTYKPQTVFNLSAYGAYSRQNDGNLIYETNLIGTHNILEECKGISAYIHAGSSSEYGFNCEGPDEQSLPQPNSHYSISKLAASYLISYVAQQGIPALNLRLYSIYGPWEEPDRLIPKLIESGIQGRFPPLVNPDISRDFVYIDDCIGAFIRAATRINEGISGQSLNIGSGVKTTMRELVTVSSSLFNITSPPQWGTMPNRKWDLNNWYGNYKKAEKAIGWKPVVSLEEGLRRTADWQKEVHYLKTIIPAFSEPGKINKISCVIACYKDGLAIPFMYERLVGMFAKLGVGYEIIFVNDGSPDNSGEVLEEICNNDANVMAVTHSRNFGSQAAFVSGMEISSGDAVVLMDGDLQDPPEIIPAFYEKWLQGFEVVYGIRVKREATFLMNVFYKLFYRIFQRLSYVPIPKDAGDFALMDRKVVNELIALPEKEQFLRGLRAWVGFKQTGVDYVRPERMFGVSTNNWRKNIAWAKKAIFSFSFVPLELISYLGFSVTGLSFLAIIWQIIAKIIYPGVPQGLSTIIVLILFFGGIQLLSISFLGEYLAKIFEESKARPKFIRRSLIFRGRKLDTAEEITSLLNTRKKV